MFTPYLSVLLYTPHVLNEAVFNGCLHGVLRPLPLLQCADDLVLLAATAHDLSVCNLTCSRARIAWLANAVIIY